MPPSVSTSTKEAIMNWDAVKGRWNEIKGEVHGKWAKLTDDDLMLVSSKFEALIGRLQQRYGYSRERAEQEVDSFIKSIPTTH
jgi:uncharacterized protein YjbJ (UPF0337 family)